MNIFYTHEELPMNAAAARPMDRWKQHYEDIASLYALNDDLIASIPGAADPQQQMEWLDPLIETIGESTDILTEEYLTLCERGKAHGVMAKNRVEAALRKIYMGMRQFSAHAAQDTTNAAHAIVARIRRQLERVITHFVEFVALSLSLIMQKQEADAIQAQHASIALMMQAHRST